MTLCYPSNYRHHRFLIVIVTIASLPIIVLLNVVQNSSPGLSLIKREMSLNLQYNLLGESFENLLTNVGSYNEFECDLGT